MKAFNLTRFSFSVAAGLFASGLMAPVAVADSPKKGGTLVWAIQGTPRHLNPAVQSGIATGQPIRVRAAFKPTSSILTPVETITRTGEAADIATKGRHDPCVGIRGVPVVEAMVALVLADQALLHRAQCG